MAEKSLNEYIDMEAYDVVSGEHHRDLEQQYELLRLASLENATVNSITFRLARLLGLRDD